MSPWNWSPARSSGIWRHGPDWLRPLTAAVPWITVALMLTMLNFVSGSCSTAPGVLFDLPDAGPAEGEPTSMVALVMPMQRDTLVFFDDARYCAGDEISVAAFGDHLADRAEKAERKTLLVLADRRVAAGELMKIADIARRSGVKRLLFAEKKGGGTAE